MKLMGYFFAALLMILGVMFLAAAGQATSSSDMVLVEDAIYAVHPIEDPMEPARYLHTATKLMGGFVFIAGGIPSDAPDAQAIPESLLFAPKPDGL